MIRRRIASVGSIALACALVLVTRAASAQTPPEAAPAAPAPAPAAAASAAPASTPQPAAPAPAPAPAPDAPATPAKKQEIVTLDSLGVHAVTWDMNLEGGFGRAFGDNHARTVSFARVRGGVMWVHGQWFTIAGAFYDLSNFTPGTFGIQLEQMHLSSGMWIQVGAGIDVEPRPMGMLALGWSVLGVEAQYRSFGDGGIGPAIFGKLRIPIGVIGFALSNRK